MPETETAKRRERRRIRMSGSRGLEVKKREGGKRKKPRRKEALDWMAVGRRIGARMEERYGSVARFCRRLGVSSAAVYRNVNGVQEPGLDSLLLYRECLGCSLDALLGRIQPDRDAGVAWRESVWRIRKYRRRWPLEDRFRMACLVLEMIPEEAERALRREKHMDSDPGGSGERSVMI